MRLFLLAALAPLAACAAAGSGVKTVSHPAEACAIAPESPLIADLMDDAATLYACPEGVNIDGMLPVGSDMGTRYYSVPKG